jgi:hypothetical protein
MGKREDYTTCMVPWMKGGGPDRKVRFCVGAKICSGKASNEEEARRLCAEAAANPKPKKARKSRKGSEAEPFDTTTLIPHCEKKLMGMVKSGELPRDTDITGICELILG